MSTKSYILASMGGVAVGALAAMLLMKKPSPPKKAKSTTGSKPKLYYFDIAGKAEASRLICAYANLDFDDVRFKSRDEFIAMKTSGELPYGQVPVLKVGDEFIGQSSAIAKFLGKKAGVYPLCDDILAAKIDSILDQEADLFTGLTVSKYPGRYGFGGLLEPSNTLGDDKKADVDNSAMNVKMVREALATDTIPRHLGNLERLLEEGGTGYMAGTPGPTVADFVLVPRLQWLASGALEGIPADILVPYPGLTALVERLLALPAIKAYYS